jgi:uncharacterized protein
MKSSITYRFKVFATAIMFALVCGSNALLAQKALPKSSVPMPDEQLFGYIGKDPLPPGTLPWQLLRQVKLVESKAKDAKPNAGNTKSKNTATWLPEFSKQLKELDKQEVKLYGFVLPLSTSAKQKHFLISPLPSHCPFCVSQGPDSMVEVIAKTPVEFNQWDPIVVTGKLELVNDQYLFFRLTDAESIKF